MIYTSLAPTVAGLALLFSCSYWFCEEVSTFTRYILHILCVMPSTLVQNLPTCSRVNWSV